MTEPLSAERLAEFRERLSGFCASEECGVQVIRTPEPEVRAIAFALLVEVERLTAENHAVWESHGKRFLDYAQIIHDLKAERDGSQAEVERLVARVAELEARIERLRNSVRGSYRTAMDEAVKVSDYDRVAALRNELRALEDAWAEDALGGGR